MSRLLNDLDRLTAGVKALRQVYLLIHAKGDDMPPLIEIKGLGAAVAAAKKGISDVRTEVAGLGTDTAALTATVKDVRKQVNDAHDDLKFEASTLGNGGEQQSEKDSEKPKDGSGETFQPAGS